VESLCVSQTEEQPWALSNALGTASLKECLNVINNIVAKSKDEESSGRSLIMTAANFFRDCLKMRIFMQEKRFSNGNDVYNYLNQRASDQNKTKAERGSIEAMHPFRAKNIAEQALRYRPAQMVKAIKALRDAAWQVNSSTISPKKALENALVGLGISKSPRSKSPKSDKNLQLGTCN
jgi:DNA polymerase III delta subunit